MTPDATHRRLASRIAGFFRSGEASSNGANGAGDREAKSGVTLSLGPGIEFISGDGGRTISQLFGGRTASDVDRVTQLTAYAAAAYCYIAVRFRMRQIAEAPLVVAETNPEDGSTTFLPDHPLAEILEDPSVDYDMSTLMQRTVAYMDITGACLWAKDPARGGMIGRLTPFHQGEFTVEQTDDRIYGRFELQSTAIPPDQRERVPEEVVLFQEPNPFDWWSGLSKVDVVLGQLNLGKQATASTKDILRNALFPSVIIQTAPDWNPDEDEWARFKQHTNEYSRREHKGGPFFATGGGNATQVGITLKDLIPTDILRSVESVVAATFAVPAIQLQYQVGLENSPWSQMSESRRMAYEDSIEPTWREYERALTRQLLRAPVAPGGPPLDDDRTRSIVFDTTHIRALQVDVAEMTEVAVQQSRIATLNERRMLVGLEPVRLENGEPDPRAEVIPELERPQPTAPPDGAFENPFAADAPPADEEDEEDEEAAEEEQAFRLPRLTRKSTPREILATFRLATKQATDEWEGPVAEELRIQRNAIARLAERTLEKGRRPHRLEAKQLTPEDVDALVKAIEDWLEERGVPRLRAIVYPLVRQTATEAVRTVAGALDLSFTLLQIGLTDYASEETVFLADVMGETTGQLVAETVQRALEDGDTVQKLTRRLRDDAAFSRDRARLVARTETTRPWNGAQRRQLAGYQDRTGTGVRKTWLSARDDRVRPEHEALDGTTLPIDGTFANGLTEPGEPNCRCTLTYELVEAE